MPQAPENPGPKWSRNAGLTPAQKRLQKLRADAEMRANDPMQKTKRYEDGSVGPVRRRNPDPGILGPKLRGKVTPPRVRIKRRSPARPI